MPKAKIDTPARENAIDVRVGLNIRDLRLRFKVSQMTLAAVLGITFQQVQKYEKGTNRVSASKLQLIAEHFDVAISVLFDGCQNLKAGSVVTMPKYDIRTVRAAAVFDELPTERKNTALRVLQALSKETDANEAKAAA